MKTSKYNIYLKDNNKNYIFNTWKGSIVEFEDPIFNHLKNNDVDLIDSKDKDTLLKLGILTNSLNEFKDVFEENNKFLNSENDISICITPTFKCNAKCEYCFERGINGGDMTDETFNNVIKYLKTYAKNKKVHITWFGGEPLLMGEKITHWCELLKEEGIKFRSSIITNGFYLNEHIKQMKDIWMLRNIQVTLDSLYAKYDAIKKIGNNSFEKVISNIHLAVEAGFNVTIRVNYNSESYSEYLGMIKYIHSEFGNKVNLYFHDIVGKDYKTPNEVNPNPLLEIYEQLINYGYIKNIKDMRIKRTYRTCAINKYDFVNVCPDGSVTKCEHYVGRVSKFSVGNINDSNFNPKKMFEVIHKDCANCICFPLCGGGCLSNHMVKENGGCVRIKSEIDKFVLLYIKRLYHENSND